MKSNLSDIASIAEIMASICVVLSLVFVGLQINEGNRETRAATAHALIDSELFMAKTLIEHSGTWAKVLNGAALEEGEELRKGINLYNMTLIQTEDKYIQFKSGYIDAADWQESLEALRPFRALPIYEYWKSSGGAASRSAEFRDIFHNLSESNLDP
jgi:hypothetical protein